MERIQFRECQHISSKGGERVGADEQLDMMGFESVGHFEWDLKRSKSGYQIQLSRFQMCYLLGETYLNPRIEARPVCGLEVRLGLEGDLVDTFAQDGELAGGFRGGLEQVHAVPILVCRPARVVEQCEKFSR